ncbi:uncharacterized protein LOC115665594 isoform X2 [Syzygium oleosum]|uniref:uncharacterized protein LOC115665594 isoform X2 n=1 Tax=Syzygium oleosum TaxID=219896 RepID=UPI0024BA120F|nr:uncharacterized protein LOC115665594 isoform X2 [Syzygium oleosum]
MNTLQKLPSKVYRGGRLANFEEGIVLVVLVKKFRIKRSTIASSKKRHPPPQDLRVSFGAREEVKLYLKSPVLVLVLEEEKRQSPQITERSVLFRDISGFDSSGLRREGDILGLHCLSGLGHNLICFKATCSQTLKPIAVISSLHRSSRPVQGLLSPISRLSSHLSSCKRRVFYSLLWSQLLLPVNEVCPRLRFDFDEK